MATFKNKCLTNKQPWVLIKTFSLVTVTTVTLSACSWVGLDKTEFFEEPEATLADLAPAQMPDASIMLPKVDLDTLTKNYLDVMETTRDAEIQVQVMQRLAGLDMLKGELQLAEGRSSSDMLQIAIQAYHKLLADYPNRPDNDRLLYQLSKAYDLSAKPDQSLQSLSELVSLYPDSVHKVEAEFRRAEIYFSRSSYVLAEQSYGAVIAAGESSDYYQNALYMHGWSQFKRDRYRAGLSSFSKMLDLLIPQDNNLEALSRAERELANDTLRVMSVSFTYLEGSASLSTFSKQQLGNKHYLPLLYDRLGELYLSLERYRDSAETYRAFAQNYPEAVESPAFYGKLIKVFETGNFSQQVLQEKENYVERYGINSSYWNNGSDELREQIKPHLKQYLKELAQYHHALAQSLVEQQGKLEKKSNKSSHRKTITKLTAQAQTHFIQAGDYYHAFVETFPADKQVAEMLFLLAESRFEAGRFEQAVAAYETVAYQYAGDNRAANAGYAAILSYQKILQQEDSDQTVWQKKKIDSALRFADHFAHDKRAALVLAQAAEELLDLKQYAQAINAADKLTRWSTPLSKPLQRTAWVVMGHSEFELQQYEMAEIAYQKTLLVTEDKQQRKQTQERLAASIYKQGEKLSAEGESQSAAEQFLRVAQAAPGSSIVINAQYDAAINLMAAKAWQLAINQWVSFRKAYPKHELTKSIPTQLIEAYQATEQWQLAANELYAVSQNEADPEAKRQALYRAAELYEQADDRENAILRFRSYAHTYPEPFKQVMEARYRLSELYRETKQPSKRRFWLKKMIAGQDQVGKKGSERSRFLAAFSQSILAEDAYQTFRVIKLTLPLKKSLKKKKTALTKALKAYQKSIDYGVQEFATMGTFRIGEIYAGLSHDLLHSKRPANLDAMALDQYQLLLEEQAYPFEERAIEIHEANAQRSWKGVYDQGVKNSFLALETLLPARYKKHEQRLGVSDDIY